MKNEKRVPRSDLNQTLGLILDCSQVLCIKGIYISAEENVMISGSLPNTFIQTLIQNFVANASCNLTYLRK